MSANNKCRRLQLIGPSGSSAGMFIRFVGCIDRNGEPAYGWWSWLELEHMYRHNEPEPDDRLYVQETVEETGVSFERLMKFLNRHKIELIKHKLGVHDE